MFFFQIMRTLSSYNDEVAHVIGSSRGRGRRRSWKQYWIEETGEAWPDECQMGDCYNECVLGAHIYIRGRAWQNYILPCCQDCNNNVDLRHHSRDNPNWSRPEHGAIVVEAPNSER